MGERQHHCVTLYCDECGADFGPEDEGTWHFDDAEDAYKQLADCDRWIFSSSLRQLICPRCADKALCEVAGHQHMSEWRDVANERFIGRARRCWTCGFIESDPPVLTGPQERSKP